MSNSSVSPLFPYSGDEYSHFDFSGLNCSYLESLDPNNSLFDPNCPPPGGAPSAPWWIQLIVQVLYGVVCCVGLCGNTLVIYVVVRFSKMQTVTNLYIVNLAIADECFLVGIPFLMTTIGLGYWPFGNVMCKAYFTSTSINQITSSMFLLIMSADRYLAVCHPISAPRWRTPLIAKFVALTAWTLSALIMVPIYMYANTLTIDQKSNCNIFWPSSESWTGESIFIVYSFIISFAVPFILISIFYVLVIMKLKTVGPKRRQGLPQGSGPPSIAMSGQNDRKSSAATSEGQNHLTPQQISRAKDRKRSHRKVTKLVLTVITVYFICWFPYWITQMALIFMPRETTHSETMLALFLLAGCLSYSNSTMNPILYAFLSDNFKKSFLKACTCAKGQDVNAQLHMDNSIFPRGKRGEKGGGKGSKSTSGQGNTGSGVGAGKEAQGLVGGAKNLLQVPHCVYSSSSQKRDDEDSGDSEDDDGAAILPGHNNGTGLASGRGQLTVNLNINHMTNTPSTSTTTGGAPSMETQSTFIQDGVHVTAL